MLVLLIIFMITAPLLAKGVKVNLPQASAAMPINQKDPIVVTVGKDGKIALGADELSAEALIDGIKVMMGDDQSRVVHIRGDTEAVYGEVVAVMDKLATNGITHIAIMTNSRSKTGAGMKAAPGRAAPAAVGAPPAQAPAAAAGSEKMTDLALSPHGMAREGDHHPPSGPEPVKPALAALGDDRPRHRGACHGLRHTCLFGEANGRYRSTRSAWTSCRKATSSSRRKSPRPTTRRRPKRSRSLTSRFRRRW